MQPEKILNNEEDAYEIPEVGDIVRTKKMQMTGKVEKVELYSGYLTVYFRTEDGRLMRAPVDNVSVVEKLSDGSMNEGFPYDVDHLPGKVIKGELSNQTVRYFYNEWKELADRANAEQHDNNLLISSGPESVLYQEDDGTIYAKWDKKKKVGFVKGKTTEGSMGGINRSAPAQDVSYEKVLDEVMNLWKESCKVNELSVDTMQNYKKIVTSPAAVQTRPLRKLAKSVIGFKQASDKIANKTGDRTGGRPKHGQISAGHELTYEERLSKFLNVDEDFGQILQHQHDRDQSKKKVPVKDIPFHGWTIRYRPTSTEGEKVQWLVLNKKHEEVKRGESMSNKDAITDAEDWIKSGGGTQQQASSKVTIDFNVDFAKEFAPGNETLYIMFDKNGNTPVIYVSTEPQVGFKKTHIRNQKHKMTSTTIGLPMVGLSAEEANKLGLQPNGRYLLGSKDPVDNDTAAFPLIFQGVVQGKGDIVKMGKPGLTVAHNREVNETCWKNYKQIGMKVKGGKKVPNCVPVNENEYTLEGDEFIGIYEEEIIAEAEYQGRKVTLNKPMQGDVKKFKVYVKDPTTGNVKKVNFGDPDMKIRKSNPAARKSFRARHNCDNPGPKTKARYWSCRKW